MGLIRSERSIVFGMDTLSKAINSAPFGSLFFQLSKTTSLLSISHNRKGYEWRRFDLYCTKFLGGKKVWESCNKESQSETNKEKS